ncbi:hypothetical protein [Marinilactibacillus psychrotolerans]
MKSYMIIPEFNLGSKFFSLVKELNERNLMVIVVSDESKHHPIY